MKERKRKEKEKEGREGRRKGPKWSVFLTHRLMITQLISGLMGKGDGRSEHSGGKSRGVTQSLDTWGAEVWKVCALGKTLVPRRLCRQPCAAVKKCPISWT